MLLHILSGKQISSESCGKLLRKNKKLLRNHNFAHKRKIHFFFFAILDFQFLLGLGNSKTGFGFVKQIRQIH